MSPSANELEHNIGRPLKKGDILIDNDGTAFEITNPKIPAGRGKSRSGTIFEENKNILDSSKKFNMIKSKLNQIEEIEFKGPF